MYTSTCVIMLEKFGQCYFHGLIGHDRFTCFSQSNFFHWTNFDLALPNGSDFYFKKQEYKTLGLNLFFNLENNHLRNYSMKCQLAFDKATSYITKFKHYKVQKVNKICIQRTAFSKQYRCSIT